MRDWRLEIKLTPNLFTHAWVRPPGASFAKALAEHPQPIDVPLARQQHAEYVDALRETGVRVEILEPNENFPDACFMQDPALVLGDAALLNRMGAPSRVGETGLVAEILRARFATHALTAPATLEGGDVLKLGDLLIVGESARTNVAGIAQLREWVGPRGVRVASISVREFLHLLTVVTYAGQGTLVIHEDFAAQFFAQFPSLHIFDQVLVPRAEAYAANTLAVGDRVIVPAGFPKTSEQLRAQGFQVLPVPMSEFYKADGGVSCLALVW